jgi:hypothetical protein
MCTIFFYHYTDLVYTYNIVSFFHVYLYGDVFNQVNQFKSDMSKIIEKIIEWVMISKFILGADFSKYIKQMQC